jgi:hypothetical protein
VYTINRHTLNSKLLNFYKRTIVGTFKTIYLTSIGFLFRNAADSLIYKNAAATDGVVGVLENFKYEYRAMKMLEMYNNIQKEAMSRLGENKGKFNRYLINKVLLDKDAETQAVYKIVDLFINTSASGGLTKSLQDYLLNFNLTQKGYNGFWFEKYWNDMMTNLPPMRQVQDINSTIEQSARLGLFLKLIDTGDDYSSAIRKVIDTHFNYDLKEPGVELMEQIFWFSTFPINNFMFYINEGITKNPELIKMQLDLLEQSYNSNGITWEDTRNSKYLTNNALAGNLRIYSKDSKGIILKTGSSVMDFFNILINPTSEMIDRLNPYLSVLFGIEDIEQLLPWVSVQNRLKQIKEGRSYVPSVYAKLYEDRKPKTQIPRNYKTSNWYFKPRRRYFKRYNNAAVMRSMHLATKRYNRRLNKHYWDVTTTPMDPGWYTHSARYKRLNRAYNRKLRSYYKTR